MANDSPVINSIFTMARRALSINKIIPTKRENTLKSVIPIPIFRDFTVFSLIFFLSQTHTHTLSGSLEHAQSLSIAFLFSLISSLSQTHTHTFSLTHTHPCTQNLFLSLSFPLSLSLFLSHTRTHTTLSHTHTLTPLKRDGWGQNVV